MTLCLIISAFCGKQASLTIVSQTFRCVQSLLKRCEGKVGDGDIFMLFQDVYGVWTKYDWTNWNFANGRKERVGFIVSKEQNKCLQQIQQQQATQSQLNESMFDQLTQCILECTKHSNRQSSKNYIYQIVVIGNEHCLSLNDSFYTNAHGTNNQRLKGLLSTTECVPINVSMLCLSSPPKTKPFEAFDVANNVCSVCNHSFLRGKAIKKQHFNELSHQIALKQIKLQKTQKFQCPPLKKRKLNENQCEMEAILFWQKLIGLTSGIFRWILTDFTEPNFDSVLESMTNKIASHTKLRWLAMGSLMAKIKIFPGPNNEYFSSPSNAKQKIQTFQSMNEQQMKFEIVQNRKKNPFMEAIYQNLSKPHCPLTILHESSVNMAIGGDILSILGFLDRSNEWISIPVISRHFILRFDRSDICQFVKDLMIKTNRIGVVSLNPPNKAMWYGFIYPESNCLILDILSPFVNVCELIAIQSQQQKEGDILSAYDSVASHFPTNNNVSKEFDKFVRCIKQKKICECFEIAQNIKAKAVNFHIPHLLKHLLSVIQKEKELICFDLPQENELKHQLDILNKLIYESQTDKRLKIEYFHKNNSQHTKKK